MASIDVDLKLNRTQRLEDTYASLSLLQSRFSFECFLYWRVDSLQNDERSNKKFRWKLQVRIFDDVWWLKRLPSERKIYFTNFRDLFGVESDNGPTLRGFSVELDFMRADLQLWSEFWWRPTCAMSFESSAVLIAKRAPLQSGKSRQERDFAFLIFNFICWLRKPNSRLSAHSPFN